jgi:succinoglycan biosynthesis transport protein ExoP
MELNRYISPLLKWWWLLAVSAVLAGASSYFVVSQQPPVYQASATLMIGRAFQDPNPTSNEFNLSQQLARTYADIAGRQPVRQHTMATLGLNSLPQYIARPLPNSQMLEIVVTDVNPQRAQAVANEVANQLILQSPTAPSSEEQERKAFINDQLNSLQVKIGETEAEILEKEGALEDAFSAREIADLEAEIAGLQSKLTTLQANYAGLLSSTGQESINTLTLIEPAGLPRRPTGTGVLSAVAAASAIALTLAAGTAYLLEYLDDTIRTPEDIRSIPGAVALPSIPKFQSSKQPEPLIAGREPRSPAANSFRALRTSILTKEQDFTPKVLLVSSTAPREGKSLVSANLAIVLAQGGHQVLLVDADLRRPVQHRLFEINKSPGLAELLLDYDPAETIQQLKGKLKDVVKRMEEPALNILTSGAISAEAPKLLSSELMKKLLTLLSAQYDYLVIDSPPFLAASDSLVLGSEVDGVILVAEAGRTRGKELKDVVGQLQAVNANLVGVSLNRMKTRSAGYYYRYYEYYQRSGGSPETIRDNGHDSGKNGTKATALGRLRNRIGISDRK